MMNIASKIVKLRKSLGMSQYALYKKAGISQGALSEYESGKKTPGVDVLEKICTALGMSLSDFFIVENNKTQIAPNDEILKLRDRAQKKYDEYELYLYATYIELDEVGRKKLLDYADDLHMTGKYDILRESEWLNLPLYLESASAGIGNPLTDQAYETIRIQKEKLPPKADICIRIVGDSMSPEINTGDVVYVQSKAPLKSGDIGIFVLDGSAYCKKIIIDSEVARLVSLNLTYPDVIVKNGESLWSVGKVLGKVQ
jgi:transcriptional regulator with XRE-family HTH domain